jgi:hypothetical protein
MEFGERCGKSSLLDRILSGVANVYGRDIDDFATESDGERNETNVDKV